MAAGALGNQNRAPVRLAPRSAKSQASDPSQLGDDYQQQLAAADRKSAGAYYTPRYIVDFIVAQTIGQLLPAIPPTSNGQRDTKSAASRLTAPWKIVDPACGGGWFLLGAYEFLLRWFRGYYLAQPPAGQEEQLEQAANGQWELTFAERRRILLDCIHGVDIDPGAVDVAKKSLLQVLLGAENVRQSACRSETWKALSANIRCGNAIVAPHVAQRQRSPQKRLAAAAPMNPLDWQAAFPAVFAQGGFDAVIGNPPYLDSELMAGEFQTTRDYCAGEFQCAAGNWDMFCVFCEQALRLCHPDGLASLVVPNKLGSASYVAATRRFLAHENTLLFLRDYSRCQVFDAAVYPIVYVARRGRPAPSEKPVRLETMRPSDSAEPEVESCQELPYRLFLEDARQPWPLWISDESSPLIQRLKSLPPLSAQAQVLGAATVAEAYAIRDLVAESEPTDRDSLRLINSGTIDRYRSLWGKKKCRYLGGRFLRPAVAGSKIDGLPAKRADQARTPKIIVAGLTRRLECVADRDGSLLAGKSTTIILRPAHLDLLLGILNSRLLSFYFVSVFGGNKLQGGYLRSGPPQLKALPIPTVDPDGNNPQQSMCVRAIVTRVRRLEALGERISQEESASQRERLERKVARTDDELDTAVYQLYGLSDAEIQIVRQFEGIETAKPRPALP